MVSGPCAGRLGGLRAIWFGKAVEKPIHLGGEHLASDDSVSIEHQVGLDSGLSSGIVGNLIGIPLYPLACIPL